METSFAMGGLELSYTADLQGGVQGEGLEVGFIGHAYVMKPS